MYEVTINNNKELVDLDRVEPMLRVSYYCSQ